VYIDSFVASGVLPGLPARGVNPKPMMNDGFSFDLVSRWFRIGPGLMGKSWVDSLIIAIRT